MQLVKPNSEELREIKAQAIINRDIPLLEQLQEVEGKEFYLVTNFLGLIQVTSIEDNDLDVVEATALRERLKSVLEGE